MIARSLSSPSLSHLSLHYVASSISSDRPTTILVSRLLSCSLVHSSSLSLSLSPLIDLTPLTICISLSLSLVLYISVPPDPLVSSFSYLLPLFPTSYISVCIHMSTAASYSDLLMKRRAADVAEAAINLVGLDILHARWSRSQYD